jgi:hypothetical protein
MLIVYTNLQKICEYAFSIQVVNIAILSTLSLFKFQGILNSWYMGQKICL